MPPELLFAVELSTKMLVAAAFVIAATVAAERGGAVIGALIATLPISAGPAYVFLAFDHPPSFLAASALTSLVANAGTGCYALAFVLLAQRFNLAGTMAGAACVWLATAVGFNALPVHWTPLSAAALNAAIIPLLSWISRPYRDVPMPRLPLRPFDFVLRGLLVAGLVAAVITLSFQIGPRGTGVLAVFPLIYTSIMVVLFTRAGAHAAAAVIANGFPGLFGFGVATLTLSLTVEALGSPAALSLALAVSIAWNLGLYFIHRLTRVARLA